MSAGLCGLDRQASWAPILNTGAVGSKAVAAARVAAAVGLRITSYDTRRNQNPNLNVGLVRELDRRFKARAPG